jgi:hypothetical protein
MPVVIKHVRVVVVQLIKNRLKIVDLSWNQSLNNAKLAWIRDYS